MTKRAGNIFTISDVSKIYIKSLFVFAALATLFMLQMNLEDNENEIETLFSHKKSVLQEIQDARHHLAYSVLSHDNSWTLTTRNMLWYHDKIAGIFTKEDELSKKIKELYSVLSSGISLASELRSLLKSEKRNEDEVENIVRSIKEIVKQADKVGPLLAKSINGTWETPPSNLSNNGLINYYSNILSPKDATGEMVKIKMQ